MTKSAACDVLVVGGGLVGAATALALSGQGLRIVLLEAAGVPEHVATDGWDSRIYAISPGNAAFLGRLGVWDALDETRITPIEDMQVWGDDGHSRLDFSAYQAGAAALGYIVESRLLQAGLWARLAAQSDVELVSGVPGQALQWEAAHALLTLQDGRALGARLVVGADGARSWTRQQARVGTTGRDYGQSGVVANFETALPHGNIARQWFRSDGILAWLPLPGRHVSIVWSTPPAHAHDLLSLSAEAFSARVAEAGGTALGAMRLVTSPTAFPLRLQNAEALVKPRLALVGDAAHLVHPLAGQGVNLGFHDAAVLAQVLMDRGAQDDVGDYGLLRRYERARKADILAMQATTTGLHDMFGSPWRGIGTLRNWGLRLTNRQGWLKKHLIAHAMQ